MPMKTERRAAKTVFDPPAYARKASTLAGVTAQAKPGWEIEVDVTVVIGRYRSLLQSP